MSFIYRRTANYYETDQMGVVHHSNHIRYFEEARIAFMKSIGCDVAQMEKEGIIIPNVDAYARSIIPILFGDTAETEIQLTKRTGAVMRYEYTARLGGNIAATGHTEHCFVNSEFRPMSLRKKFPEYYRRLKDNISTEE